MDKEETRLLKKLTKCKTRKCSKLYKDLDKEKNIYQKGWNKKCSHKRNKAYIDCDKKFFKGSRLEKLYDKVGKCSKKKCSTQKKKLNQYRNKHW